MTDQLYDLTICEDCGDTGLQPDWQRKGWKSCHCQARGVPQVPQMKQRYLNLDGSINWAFLKGPTPPNLTDKERQVWQLFNGPDYFNIYHRVKLLLASWGEYTITDADREQQRQAQIASRVLAREREERYRRHAAWGRGRKTSTARR